MIFAHLASKWIVEGRGSALRDLLQSLDREEITKEIENWDSEGSVLIDYFEVQFFIEELQAKNKVSYPSSKYGNSHGFTRLQKLTFFRRVSLMMSFLLSWTRWSLFWLA